MALVIRCHTGRLHDGGHAALKAKRTKRTENSASRARKGTPRGGTREEEAGATKANGGVFPFVCGFAFFVSYVISFAFVPEVWPLGLRGNRFCVVVGRCGDWAAHGPKVSVGSPGPPNVPHVGFMFSLCFF